MLFESNVLTESDWSIILQYNFFSDAEHNIQLCLILLYFFLYCKENKDFKINSLVSKE